MARKHNDGPRNLIMPGMPRAKENPWVWQDDTRKIRTPKWLRPKTWAERKIQRQLRRMHQVLNRLGMAKTPRNALAIDIWGKEDA